VGTGALARPVERSSTKSAAKPSYAQKISDGLQSFREFVIRIRHSDLFKFGIRCVPNWSSLFLKFVIPSAVVSREESASSRHPDISARAQLQLFYPGLSAEGGDSARIKKALAAEVKNLQTMQCQVSDSGGLEAHHA
jgi:hypothetical protein